MNKFYQSLWSFEQVKYTVLLIRLMVVFSKNVWKFKQKFLNSYFKI